MPVQVRVPTPLRGLTGNQAKVTAAGATVREVLEDLDRQFPGLRQNLYDEKGDLRSFINIYLNDEDIRHLSGEGTPVDDGDEVSIMPAIAGG
ncbi:MAG: MoaD/ThiS family protein [Chloroflexi bacterium]|nr:MoaD/ThiS family protein [Chloroflexota bacterium]MBI4506738.1 MoaD/ThiS family protein [Chloroflexota bacterium]